MSEWKETVFEELFEISLKNGLNKPSRVRGTGIRMVNMKEIFGYDKITDSTPMELVPVESNELNSLLRYDDLLFARQSLTEEGAGKISIYKGQVQTVFESHLIRCRINKSKADPDFVYYLFKSPLGKNTVSTIVSQTAAAGIRGSELQKLVFKFPKIETQRKVANLLSSLDDKIDLLHRQNKTLEEMAEALWRKWFVEDIEKNEEVPLSHYAISIRNNVATDQLAEHSAYVGLEHIPKQNLTLTTWGSTTDLASNKSAFKKNDILFGKLRSYFHKVVLAPIDGVCSTDILVIRPKREEWLSFCLMWFFSRDVVEYSDLGAGGTRMPRTSWELISEFKIPKPSQELILQFESIVRPMLDKMRKSIYEIQNLAQLRESLLPKLMNGEINFQ